MRIVAAVFIGSLFAASCAEPNTLEGSISQSHDLTFDTVSVRLLSQQKVYEIKYLKALDSGDDDVVAKVVFNQPDGGAEADAALDLLELEGKVERITAANDPFPDGLDKANAVFTSGGNDDGEATVGSFASTFDNGKTLNGAFDADLEIVDF